MSHTAANGRPPAPNLLKRDAMKRAVVLAVAVVFGFSSSLFAPGRQDKCWYIEKYLKEFDNLEYAEVLAKVDVESSGREYVKRFEKRINCFARGPMQITDKTARLAGYRWRLEYLQTWEHGLYWGMKHLSSMKKVYAGSRWKAFAAYNAGGVRYNKRGLLRNRKHVGKCEARYEYYKPICDKFLKGA